VDVLEINGNGDARQRCYDCHHEDEFDQAESPIRWRDGTQL
jgi:hypothetical protein